MSDPHEIAADVSFIANFGLILSQQEPGTVIRADGKEMVVTDTNAVVFGQTIYVTPKVYAAVTANLERTHD